MTLKIITADSESLNDLISKHRQGKTNLAPYAEVEFYIADNRVGATDFNTHQKNMVKLFKQPSLMKLSTRQVTTPDNYDTLVGQLESLLIDIETLYGGQMELSIIDAESGENLNRFLTKIKSTDFGIYTTYAKVKFGWMTNLGYVVESKSLAYLLKDITSDFAGGKFTYTITGIEYPIPYFTVSPVSKGNFGTTIGDALDAWEDLLKDENGNKQYRIVNRELINTESKLRATNFTINPFNQTPFRLLENILKYARVKKNDANVDNKYGAVMWHVPQIDANDPTGPIEISLAAYTNKTKEVYKTYSIGTPDSIVLDGTSFHNDLATSRLGTIDRLISYNVNDNTTREEDKPLTSQSNNDSNSAVRKVDKSHLDTNESKLGQDRNSKIPNYDTIEASIVTIGDPGLIPDRTVKSPNGQKQFYNSTNPFLGVEVKAFIQKPLNMYKQVDLTPSQNNYVNGVYMVDKVIHSINRDSYTTTIDCKKFVNVVSIITGK